jgi:ubiquinone/menaquinone biosynthesis C-methylase UbiE
MSTNLRSSRWSQSLAWVVAGLLVAGLFISSVGAWTGPILGVWFVGTQRLRRGFLWMLAFAFLPSLMVNWRKFPMTGVSQALGYLSWMLLAAVLSVLPFAFHRLVSSRLPKILSTLAFPLATMAISSLALMMHFASGAQPEEIPRAGLGTFLAGWFAAALVWMWNHESRATAPLLIAGVVLAGGFQVLQHISGTTLALPGGNMAGIACVGGVLILSIVALFHQGNEPRWADRPETVALLRSPFTGDPLHVVKEQGRETLLSNSGERFPVRHEIPVFLAPEDLTENNGKFHHMYETIGGFYDDIQRVFCALKGFDVEAYFQSYMRRLEVKPGDSVLETSVGTGLNFKYLPRGVRPSGLDLSGEMLGRCQANLRRWEMDANLYLGNAESLPFADASFDVVFHVGGINFFNDRAKAIAEMIRVAKPGSLLLIADETEEHVKSVYEKQPGGLFKNRKESVSAPIDLVPPDMQEIHLELLKDGMFYALTFRKPLEKGSGQASSSHRLESCVSEA